jgi:hypothetical protein
MQGKYVLIVNADAPFGDHLGPGVQFDGAFVGQALNKSLEAAKCEKYQSVSGYEAAHPPTIPCIAPCGT